LSVATVVTLTGVHAPVADAHFCSVPADIGVGKELMVNIGVAAEAKPVHAIDIEIPDGFSLKEPVGYLGYTGSVRGKFAHFEGGVIQPYTCQYFGFVGEATKRGRLVAEIITTADDGTRQRYTDLRLISQFPAMQIFAGVNSADYQPKTPKPASGDGGFFVALAVALTAGVLVVGTAVIINRRRA
jgi:hypothetical protein